ncbi:MAG: PilZ domain-containing protein [Candidatus Omnitrophica bacterium]|nr:PilZ domain-containing protein [Candidatus Omnitrophota bacterium]
MENIERHSSIIRLLRLISGKNKSGQLKQRVAERRPTGAPGLFKVLNRDKFYGRHYQGIMNPMNMIDISTTGCAFTTDFYIPMGAFFEVELKKLSPNYIFDAPLVASCEAVYCIPLKGELNRVGAKFLDIDNRDIERIRGFSETRA